MKEINPLEFFEGEVYGRLPEACANPVWFEEAEPEWVVMDGKAVRRRVRVCFRGEGGVGSFPVVAFIPREPSLRDGGKICPSFLPKESSLRDDGEMNTTAVAGFVYVNIFDRERVLDMEGRVRTESWPVADIVERGFAAIGFNHWDVVPDEECAYAAGAYKVLAPDVSKRTAESGGALAMWAWACSKVMDWVETEPRLDAKRMAVIGHSRGGKTALWCGANDKRFAMVVSDKSGCAGAKLNELDLPWSEQIERISSFFPYWFCGNFQKYAGRDRVMPVDQDALLALIAPRLLYVSSAAGDAWAGPLGEYEACRRAAASGSGGIDKILRHPVGMALSVEGDGELFPVGLPEAGTALHEGRVGYHIRPGEHGLRVDDWARFMDFFEKKM